MRNKKFIAVGSQTVDNEDVAYVSAMLKDDFLTQGPQVEKFEQSLSSFLQAPYVSAMSSGSAALHIACKVFGCDQDTILYSSPITFVASQNAALHFGAKNQFIDVNPSTGNMDITALEQTLAQSKAKNKIIMPVHFAGLACDLDEINALAKHYDAKVIEDASHALGAKYKGKFIGATHAEHLVTLSFHPLKHITTAEGGAVTCMDSEQLQQCNLYRSHGIDKNIQTIEDQKGKLWHHEMHVLGFNYRMSEIHAALGVSQIKKLPTFLEKRKNMASVYSNQLKEVDCHLPSTEADKEHAWLLYMIQVDFKSRKLDKNDFMLALREKGIGSQVHNIPVYRQPYFIKLYGEQRHKFPGAEKFFEQTLSIPLHPGLTEEDQAYVVKTLKELL
ncbi:MAG TPA: UDP-4-amino-4,6-dideoxy-N-acetyl-beta-L-altrosamine transaminase [Oligoflexia bacterium]|mgnify:CR=1 FL=1|nr:UDP-4-amino-4,6-dideoxy-N-acetyl-beta-L-altrosamine transaminase [Oligoflexia bacterium]HMR25198.1 UDP-4-amino-4,6-dideoxy-N-acetyl-beta-L-altrosamine transaminase [Oligoflexia bacterium]